MKIRMEYPISKCFTYYRRSEPSVQISMARNKEIDPSEIKDKLNRILQHLWWSEIGEEGHQNSVEAVKAALDEIKDLEDKEREDWL